MNVGVGLYVYYSVRSNKLVKFLSDLNENLSYDKVIDIKKDVAANIIEKSKKHDGVFVPSSFLNNEPTLFVIDSTVKNWYSRREGSTLRKGSTAIAVYQYQMQNQTKVPIFQVLYLEFQVSRILGLISPNVFKFADNYLLSRF